MLPWYFAGPRIISRRILSQVACSMIAFRSPARAGRCVACACALAAVILAGCAVAPDLTALALRPPGDSHAVEVPPGPSARAAGAQPEPPPTPAPPPPPTPFPVLPPPRPTDPPAP